LSFPPSREQGKTHLKALLSGKRGNNFALFKRCLRYFLPYKVHIFFACLFMSSAGLCDAFTAWLVKPAMDEIFVNKNHGVLLILPLAFVGVTFLKAAMKLLQNYLMQRCGLKVLEVLRDEMYDKIIRLPVGFFDASRVGVLMSQVMTDVSLIRSSMPAVVTLIRQIITLISLAAVVIWQNAELAMWAVIGVPLIVFPLAHFGRRMRRVNRKGLELAGEINSLLQEVLSGIRVVKAFGAERREMGRFDAENKKNAGLSMKSTLISGWASVSAEVAAAVGVCLVLLVGGMQVIDGRQSPGTFFSFITALVLMYEPVRKFNGANFGINAALAGAERAFGFLDNPDLVAETGGDKVLEGPFRELVFADVVFCYPDGTRALDGVCFSVRAGEKVALVGPSGAGKSTFANLIPRFYDPQEGSVSINGVPLREYSLESLRRMIAMVSQETFLFNMSVRDNILYGIPDAGEEKMKAAATAAYADVFISTLPNGYDTIIGERGVKLSGGQKQRLAIAHALVKDAPLLILDEATSALDSESERIVQAALENLMAHRTSIVIAHRLSTVLDADRILVIDRGRVLAGGRHEELLSLNPLYAKLYAMQYNAGAGGGRQGESAHTGGYKREVADGALRSGRDLGQGDH
jgi:subfamily B ATP-binding cassette protein MsbA